MRHTTLVMVEEGVLDHGQPIPHPELASLEDPVDVSQLKPA